MLGRASTYDRIRGNISCHDGTSRNDCTIPNRNASLYYGAVANPHIIPYPALSRLAMKSC